MLLSSSIIIIIIIIIITSIIIKYMVSYIKGGSQAKGIWKQDPEANIWAQEGWECGVE